MPTLQQRVRKAALLIDGVVESDAIFDEDASAFFVNGTQMANFWDSDSIAIRLTRPIISQRRTALKLDARVELRSSSDWMRVYFHTLADVAFAVDLLQLAAVQYRPPKGVAAKAPPQGADLARRRRFH